MTPAEKNQLEVDDISRRFFAGEITQAEARKEMQVIADRANEVAERLAKKYGMKKARKVNVQVSWSHGVKLR